VILDVKRVDPGLILKDFKEILHTESPGGGGWYRKREDFAVLERLQRKDDTGY
jgi:hypothetical protein